MACCWGGLFLIIVLAEEVGLHGSLGALLFGAALAPLPYQLRHDSMPGMRSTAEGLFVPLFFASAGLNLNLAFLELHPEVIAALIFVPLAAKFAGAFFSAYITRLESPVAVASGLMAKGVAEIALLLVMLHAHVIGEALFSLLVMIMFGYILLTPMGISFALRRVRHSEAVADDSDIPHLMDRFVLGDVHVRDVLDRTRVYPHPSITVRSFIDNWTTPEQHDYVVVDDDNLAGHSLLELSALPAQGPVEQHPTADRHAKGHSDGDSRRAGGGHVAAHDGELAYGISCGRPRDTRIPGVYLQL